MTGAVVASTFLGSVSAETKDGGGRTARPWAMDQSLTVATKCSLSSTESSGGYETSELNSGVMMKEGNELYKVRGSSKWYVYEAVDMVFRGFAGEKNPESDRILGGLFLEDARIKYRSSIGGSLHFKSRQTPRAPTLSLALKLR